MKSQKSQGNYNLLVTGLKLSIIWAYLYNKKQHEIKNCIESSITFEDFAFRQVEIDDNIMYCWNYFLLRFFVLLLFPMARQCGGRTGVITL